MKRAGRAAEFLAWAVFFAGCLLVLALRFWVLPDIERFRDPIVAAAARAIGQPLSVGRIEARWYGLHPRISLTDVRIRDAEGRDVLVLPSVENVVSWRSLLRGDPKLRSLTIDGLRLQVRRDAAGALYIAGMRLGADTGFREWVLKQEEIVLRNAEVAWHDEMRGAPPLVLSELHLRLENDGERHAFGLAARPPEALASTLELRALLDEGGSGRLFAELGYTDLAAWGAWLDYPVEVRRGEGALRLWVGLEHGEPTHAIADVAAAQVAATFGEGLAPLELASLQGRLQARARDGAYELAARRLALEVEGGPAVAPLDFDARWRKPAAAAGAGGAFSAPRLELEPLAFLAAALPFPAEARRLLAEVAPQGRLAQLRVEWRGPVADPASLAARGQFADLAAAPTGDFPGFAGLSGSFETTDAKGRVHLDTWKGAIELPQVFPQGPLRLDSLSGDVEWERFADTGFTVRLSSLNVANEDFSGNVYGWYSNPGSGPGSADLSAQFNRADAARLARYLPHAEFLGGKATRDWLAGAVLAGRSDDVRFRLRGKLADFPFKDPLLGEFSVHVRVADAVLDYATGWPRIEELGGELVFERDRLEIRAASGRVLGAALTGVRAGIARLDAANPRLVVSGEAQGPAADFLEYVQSTPVRAMADGMTDAMTASGRGRLRLKLELPLADPDRTRVAGEFQLLGNNVLVHRDLPVIEAAAGKVSFTESALTVHDVRGRLFGGEVTVSGGTRKDGGLQVAARGEAAVAAARPFFDHPAGKYLSGSAAYTATVQRAPRGGKPLAEERVRFVVESSLRGVASALPAPFAKRAGEDLPLRMEVVPADGGARDRVSVTLGRVAGLELQRRREGEAMPVQSAVLAFAPPAGRPLRRTDGAGLLLYGTLPALDLDAWLALLGGETGALQTAFDLKIGALDLYGKRLHEVAASGSAEGGGWTAKGVARELAGEASFAPEGGGKLVARFATFRTPQDAPGARPRTAAPADLPARLDFSAERFHYQGKDLGRVEIAGQRAGEDWLIEKLAMANADGTLHGKGAWRGGAPQRIALDFALQVSDAGQFLNRIGYRDLVKGGKAQLQGHLAWSGAPTTIDYPSLSGDVQMQAQDGQFLEIEPGLGKLVSLMSLQALPRRITLDFRDVFSKGFEFESIASAGRIDAGVMAVKEFRMHGTAAQVEMRGEVDLAAETQNLRVRVLPSLGDTASTFIGLANPLLAIPAIIVQKILKDPLGHIFAFDYAVTGGWSEPKVDRIGVEARAVNEP